VKKIFSVLAVLTYFSFSLSAFAADQKSFLVHATTGLKVDDAQICAVPNVAWTALKQGYDVSILFDASGVTALKKGGLFGGDKSPLDKAKLPDRERKSLAKQLGEPLESIPHNYGEYLQFLHKKGVKLYANNTMMLLYKIKKNDIVPNVKPLNLDDMLKLRSSSHLYISY